MSSLTPLTSDKVFSRSEYEAMTPEEKQFAQEQLRAIFSKEMSKISAGISRRKQVVRNRDYLEGHSEQEHQKLLEHLNAKMVSVELKRKQQLQKRIDVCKLHDESWKKRMKQFECVADTRDKQAVDHLQRYQADYEKELEGRRSKTQASQNKKLPHRRIESVRTEQTVAVPEITQPTSKNKSHNTSHKLAKRKLVKSHLDDLIREHQEKSKKLQEERENDILQRALNKLEHIKEVKQTMGKRRSPSPKQKSDDMLERSLSRNLEKSTPDIMKQNSRYERHEMQHRRASNEQQSLKLHQSNSKTALSNKLLIRRKLEQQHNQRHWQQYQRSIQRGKRNNILRAIRDKVAEYKLLAHRF